MLLRKRFLTLICQRVSSNSKLSLLKKGVTVYFNIFNSIFLFRKFVCFFCCCWNGPTDSVTNVTIENKRLTDRQADDRTCTPAKSDAYLSLNPLKTNSIAFVTVLVDTLFELLRYAWKQLNLILFLKKHLSYSLKS